VQVAEAAKNAVMQLGIAHEKSLAEPYTSISGIAVLFHNGISSSAQLIMEADQCLYQAKHLGRNRMVVGETEFGHSGA
jgi:PleD family two-component response regulator